MNPTIFIIKLPRSKASSRFSSSSRNMDYFNTHGQQKQPSRHHSTKRLTQDQVRLLERAFTSNKKFDSELKPQLANQLGVPPRQVAIWYQNKRARWKTQNLALDYSTLQVKLEDALAEKRRLEREILQLHEDLRKAHDMLLAFNARPSLPQLLSYQQPQNISNCSSSCDEEGGSSFYNDDVNVGEILQLDELYTCLIGSAGGGGSN